MKRIICIVISILIYACDNDYYNDFFSFDTISKIESYQTQSRTIDLYAGSIDEFDVNEIWDAYCKVKLRVNNNLLIISSTETYDELGIRKDVYEFIKVQIQRSNQGYGIKVTDDENNIIYLDPQRGNLPYFTSINNVIASYRVSKN